MVSDPPQRSFLNKNGQIDAGFLITGFYEDYRKDDPITKYMPSYMATRAIKT